MSLAPSLVGLLTLDGKVALVTGAASGIGRGIALRLAEAGAAVMVLDVNEDGGRETVRVIQEAGGQAAFQRCDVRSQEDCRRASEETIHRFGRIDILCNNAGGGSIINTGSGWALKGGPRAASYCAAKGGVMNLTRAMAIDLGRHWIRVNAVCPGDIDTPMLRASESKGRLGEGVEHHAALTPVRRVGRPEDIAAACAFLVKDEASYVTGQVIGVNSAIEAPEAAAHVSPVWRRSW